MDAVVTKKPKLSSEQLSVKFCAESNKFQVPTQATPHSAGYDLYTAEAKTILPNDLGIVSLELRWEIPNGFYGKMFSRSGFLVRHMITAEGGVINSDYRGIVKVLLINHHSSKPFEIEIEDRIAQVVFMKKYDVNFEKTSYPELLGETTKGPHTHISELLSKTKTGCGGFGSTGKN